MDVDIGEISEQMAELFSVSPKEKVEMEVISLQISIPVAW